MFKEGRIISTGILFGCLILTLVMAFALKSGVLTLVFTIGVWAAYFWYIISYIPFAQSCVKGCFKGCCQ